MVYVSPQHGQHGVLAVVQHISAWLEGAMAGPAGSRDADLGNEQCYVGVLKAVQCGVALQ